MVTDREAVPPVTVVMAAWNAAATIDTALASVAGQTMLPAAVIVVDDASTDDTAARGERWVGRLPVSVVRLDRNLGPGGARNIGVERAPTELLAILDADDIWLPDHLAAMLAAYDAQPGLITARPLFWVPGRALVAGPFEVPAIGRQLAALLRSELVVNLTLFARSDYARAGGFRGELRRGEDWDLWIRMARNGVAISAPPHPTFAYRQAGGSLTVTDDNITDNVTVLTFAVDEAASDSERREATRALRRARAIVALVHAYDAARAGSAWRARAAALRALRGPARVGRRAAFMLVAPGRGVRLRDQHRFDTTRLLDQ